MIDSVLMTGSPFADWLEKKYLEWQMESGRASIRKFSAWLGLDHASVINMMNAKVRPGPKTLPLIAAKLGYEIYEVLGVPRPETGEAELATQYGVPPEKKDEFIEDTRAFIRKWFSDHGWEMKSQDDAKCQ